MIQKTKFINDKHREDHMLKAILFDLDNTLFDYDSSHKEGLRSAYQVISKDIPISQKRFITLLNTSREEIHRDLAGTASAHNKLLYFQRSIERLFDSVKPRLILRMYRAYWRGFLASMKLFEGALEVLVYCNKNRIKTAIVSDMTAHMQLRKLERLKIGKHINTIVTSEEAGSEKPHSIMFLLTLHKLGIKPSEAIMVGDNADADIQGAKDVGIKTILVGRSKSLADHSIKKIKELLPLVIKMNSEEGYTKFNCRFRMSKPPSKQCIRDLNKYRQLLYKKGLVGAYKNKVGFGNLSIRDKHMIITGTATGNYKRLDSSKYSIITGYDLSRNELSCKGQIKASSESMTHLALYECSKDIGAVIHIHSLKMWKKYIGRLPTTSKTAQYGTPEIAMEIKRLYLQGRFKKVAVLGGHKEGLIAFGKDLKEAYENLMDYF